MIISWWVIPTVFLLLGCKITLWEDRYKYAQPAIGPMMIFGSLVVLVYGWMWK